MSRERDRNRDYLIKLRGIPYSSTRDDIKKFLHPCRIVNVHLFNENKNTSGECFVDLDSEVDVRDALKKHNQHMKNRYIEVNRATHYEYKFFLKYKGSISWREPVLRIKGLPYTCTMADIQNFFKDIEIARNGIYITRDMSDNALGGAFVAFVNMDNAYKAINIYDHQHIQHRYIELFPSTYDEAKKTIKNDAYVNGKQFSGEHIDVENRYSKRNSRSRDRTFRTIKHRRSRSGSRQNERRRSVSRSPVRRSSSDSNQHGEYRVKIRGMPYTVVENDIRQFFASSCQPVYIKILRDHHTNRPNGDGFVYFNTRDDVNEAMKLHKNYMGSRYIELYLDSSNRERSRTEPNSNHSSRSTSKTHDDDHNRSRSESEHM